MIDASTSSTTSTATSRRCRRVRSRSTRCSATSAERLACRNSRSSGESAASAPTAHSCARASRAPRYSAPASRCSDFHDCAASVSWRWVRSPSRSSVSQLVQPRPVPDQRLVRQLDVVPVERDEPDRGQPLEQLRRARQVGQLVAAHPPLGVLGAVAERAQAQEELLGDGLAGGIQPGDDVLRGPGQRVAQPAGRLVAAEGQRRAAPAPPGLQQHVGQQRQRARLVRADRDQLGDERGLHPQPGLLGRLGDDVAQLLLVERADEDLRVAQRGDELGVARAVAVEVGPHAEHDAGPAGLGAARRSTSASISQARSAGVRAEGEDLLELVDDEHEVARSLRRVGQRLAHAQVQVRRVGRELGAPARPPTRRGGPRAAPRTPRSGARRA